MSPVAFHATIHRAFSRIDCARVGFMLRSHRSAKVGAHDWTTHGWGVTAISDDNDFDEKLKAVERLVKLFRFERHVYLVITTVSLLMLLGSAGFLLLDGKTDRLEVMVALFGSSGLITYSLGRLLKMWDQALALLIGAKPEDGK